MPTTSQPHRPAFAVTEDAPRTYVRSSVTVIRLAGAALLAALVAVPLRHASDTDFSTLFGDLLASAPRWIVTAAVAAMQVTFLLPALLGIIGLLAQRRFARLGRLLLTAALAIGAMVLMSRIAGVASYHLTPGRGGGGPGSRPPSPPVRYGVGAPFPTVLDLGVIASWMFVDAPHWSPRWRRLGRLVLAAGVIARLGVALADPADIIATIVLAAGAAQLTQLMLGVPNTRPSAARVGAILERLGEDLTSVEPSDRFRGFVGFRAVRADGGQLFVKIVSRDSWATLLPVRLYRSARFRDPGQDRPFRSLRSSVEHEALCALKALADGVSTPPLTVISEFPPDAMMIAFDAPEAVPLSKVPAGRLTDEVLAGIWEVVAALRRSHSVHHHLNLDALLVDADDRVSLIEFGAAELGVAGPASSVDVAEALAATAAHVGVERAVAAAVAGIGADAVAACLPRLQPLALTRPTRSATKAAGGLDALRAEIERVTGAEPVPVAELERVKLRSIATVAMAAVALWTLIPQLVGVSAVWGKLGEANWWWVAAALGLSAATYVGAALALDGSLPERLPLVPNIGVQVATSFVGVAAPGGALALTGRFLQRRGVDAATAAAAVGVDTIAGVVVHLALTGLFVAFSGTSGLSAFNLPSLGVIGLIALGVVAAAAASWLVPWTRSIVRTRLLPATRRSMSSIAEVARQPAKVVELVGGCLVITLGYVLALEVAVAAFGSGPSFTAVALVYLLGSVVSSIAPTPGGIGAVEATLIAGLTSAGMTSPTAVAAVMVFRVTTFWLPLLPGWAALVTLQRTGDL